MIMKITSALFATLLAAATLVVAFPTNTTELYARSSFQGSINFFTRSDCQDTCVEHGYCLSGESSTGMYGSEDPFIGWDEGCWDRSDGAHSVALSVDNGHGFSGINMSCKKMRALIKGDGSWDGVRIFPMASADDYSAGQCNKMQKDVIKAVYYHW